MKTQVDSGTARLPQPRYGVRKELIVVAIAVDVGLGCFWPTSRAEASWHVYQCPVSAPYLHTDAYGNTYCSKYP